MKQKLFKFLIFLIFLLENMKFDILNVLKGGMRFPKNKEKFLQEMGGARNDGVDFIMGGGGGFFKVYLHI